MDREAFEALYGKGTKLFDLAWFTKDLPKESERGQVLIVSAFLEDMLEQALRALLPEHAATTSLLKRDGPISSFGAKTWLARSLGLINDGEYSNLETVRKIRNKFAHAVQCSFEHDEIRTLTLKLNQGLSQLDADPATKPIAFDRFRLATQALLLHLHDRADRLPEMKS